MRIARSRSGVVVAAGAGLCGLLAATALVTTASAEPEPTERTQSGSSRTAPGQQAIPPTRVTEQDHPDPAVAEINGEFWTYATFPPCPDTGCPDDNRKIRIRHAPTLQGPYEMVDLAMAPIPWADNTKAVYAPDVHDLGNGRVVLYFSAVSADPGQKGNRCIGAAVSTDGPAGPFRPRAEPIACDADRMGIIDPSYFRDPVSGRHYLLYKTNGVPRPDGAIRRIWLQQVTGDGLNKIGRPVELANRHTNIENPELVYSGNRYFLFVSRDLYRTSDYKTSVLVSTRVDGGYDNERAVLTSQNTNVSGPGGADILRTANGRTIAYHHGWHERDGKCDGYRPMYISELVWDANGRLPHLAVETPGDPRCNVEPN